MRFLTTILVLTLFACPVAAQGALTLPGGASAIREVRGDWVLVCGFQAEVKACNLRQEQRVSTTGALAIIVELVPNADALGGSVVLPLGVDLGKGATLQVDDQAAISALFQSCVANLGCVFPINLDGPQASAMSVGQNLAVSFTPVGQAAVTSNVSLEGLPGALARARELLED